MARNMGSYTPAVPQPVQLGAAEPLDARMRVQYLSDLTKESTWQTGSAQPFAPAVADVQYYGMLVYVYADGDNNGLYSLEKIGTADQAKADSLSVSETEKVISNGVEVGKPLGWVRISKSDAEIKEIRDAVNKHVTDVEAVEATKLDKVFDGDGYDQGSMSETTTFAARENNANVYITGSQIKSFAASAVSDKGVFATPDELPENPEDNWYATVLSTGTIWTASNGEWTDSGESSGVTSVNGKSGNVTLAASDFSDIYSKTEVDGKITEVSTNLQNSINEVDGKVAANTVSISGNTASINSINGQISAINTTLSNKQNSTIDAVTIGGEEKTTVKDAIDALAAITTTTTAELADYAKVDGSNITPSVWKTELGYVEAPEVESAVNAGVTTTTFSGLTTTDKTVQGAINELKSATGSNATNITSLQSGKVDKTITVNGKALSNNVTLKGSDIAVSDSNADTIDVALGKKADATSLANYLTTSSAATTYQKQNLTDKVYDDVATVEGTLARLKTNIEANDGDITNLQTAVNGNSASIQTINGTLADKANTSDVVAKTTTVNGKALSSNVVLTGADVNVSTTDTRTVAKAVSDIEGEIDAFDTSKANVADVVLNSEIDTSVPATGGEDSHVPSTKAVVTAISSVNTEIAKKANTADVVAKTQVKSDLTSASTTDVPSVKAVSDAISSAIEALPSAIEPKGSVASVSELPASPSIGWMYNITSDFELDSKTYPAGTNVVYTSEGWDAFAGIVDLSGYQTKAITATDIDATTVVGALEELASGKQDKLEYYTEENGNVTITSNSERSIVIGDRDKENVGIALNGSISGTAIDTAVTTSEYKVPTSKAVSDAITTAKSEVNSALTTEIDKKADSETVNTALEGKAAIDGSNLSTENVASWKSKLGFITADEVPEQVQSDWNTTTTTDVSFIKNKPPVRNSDGALAITSNRVIQGASSIYRGFVDGSVTLELYPAGLSILTVSSGLSDSVVQYTIYTNANSKIESIYTEVIKGVSHTGSFITFSETTTEVTLSNTDDAIMWYTLETSGGI